MFWINGRILENNFKFVHSFPPNTLHLATSYIARLKEASDKIEVAEGLRSLADLNLDNATAGPSLVVRLFME